MSNIPNCPLKTIFEVTVNKLCNPFLKLVYSASAHSQSYELHVWIERTLFFIVSVIISLSSKFQNLMARHISLLYPFDSYFTDLGSSLSLSSFRTQWLSIAVRTPGRVPPWALLRLWLSPAFTPGVHVWGHHVLCLTFCILSSVSLSVWLRFHFGSTSSAVRSKRVRT